MLGKVILAGCVASLASAGAATALDRVTHDDWSIRCDDKTYCIAETSGEASTGEAFRLKVERTAGKDSKVFVTLRPKTTLETGMRARIEIESGQEENYGYFGVADRIYTGNEMTFTGASDRELIDKLRLGRTARIQIEFGGKAGTITYEASLKGITRALLRMDEEQGRVGRLDAIVARGGQPSGSEGASAAAPAADLPPPVMPSQDLASGGARGLVYSLDEIPESVRMIGARTLDCQLQETVPGFGARYFAQGDVEVWVIPCQMADLNVPWYMVTHIPFNPSLDELHEFETPPGFNQPNHSLVNNLSHDPATGQVTGTTYHSPNYDCGAFERHDHEAESGRYVLADYLEKSACDGVTGPPEGWPLSWTIDEMGN